MLEQQDKILYLESLRGLAALSVALSHSNMATVLNTEFVSGAWLMVDFFFVLSGFVIALNYQRRVRSFSDAFNFQLRRFLRLYPLHLVTLFIFLGWEVLQYVNEVYGDVDRASVAFTSNNFITFLQNIFLLHNLTGNAATWNYPSWSISAEFYTYAVFAIILLFGSRGRVIIIALSAIIAASAFYYLLQHDMGASNGFARCLLAFFCGVLAFNLSDVMAHRLPNALSYLMLCVCIIMVCIAGRSIEIGLNILMPFLFCGLILSLSCSQGPNLLKRALNNRVLVYLGTISYGIYMLHASVWIGLALVQKYVFSMNTAVAADGVERIEYGSQLQLELVVLAGLLLTIFLAHLSYRLIERPANNLRHRLSPLPVR